MEKVKQWAWPFIAGIVVMVFAMPYLFGFYSGSSARSLADEAAQAKEDALAMVLVPLLTQSCVVNARSDPEQLAKLQAESSSFTQGRMISSSGWVEYPEGASSSLTRAIDQGCLDALEG